MRSVIPWSFSSWEAYQTCPYKFFKTRISKEYVEPESEPMIWGNMVHKAIEDYIKEGKPVPDNMQRFIPIVDRFVNAPGDTYAELELACDINLLPTGFWDDNAWCRGKGDIVKVNKKKVLNGDWKTGKWKQGSLQLDLAAVMTFASFPDAYYATTVFVYFQQPTKPVSRTFTRDDIPSVMQQFMPGVRDMEYSQDTGVWPKKPSGLCKAHCPVKDCEYHGKGSPRRY